MGCRVPYVMPRSEKLSLTLVLSSFFFFKIISKLIPRMAALIYTFPNISTVNKGSFIWGEAVFQSSFILCSHNDILRILNTFAIIIVCLYIFWKSVFSSFAHLLLAVLFPCYLISVTLGKFYVWAPVPSVTGIDSLSFFGCLCALLIVSVDVQKLFVFMLSHLLILGSVPVGVLSNQ